MKQDTIQDLRAFSQKVYDLIEEYLEETMEADGDLIDEVASQFFFVR